MLTEHPRPRLLILDLDNTAWCWIQYFGAGIEAQVKFLAEESGEPASTCYELFRRAHAELGCTEHPDAALWVVNELLWGRAAYDADGKRQLAGAARERFILAALKKLRLYPGVKPTIYAAKQAGLHVVGFTDALAVNAKFRLAATGLTLDHLCALTADSGKDDRKPSPTRLRSLAARYGVLPGDCVVVGDNPTKDIRGANDAGMISVLASYGQVKPCHELDEVHKVTAWSPEDIAAQHAPVKADFTARSFTDITRILHELGVK